MFGNILVLALLAVVLILFNQNQKLHRQAQLDPLTAALNRRGSNIQLRKALAAQGKGVCVLMVDLDHFKRINDAYGHSAGDFVLRQVTARMQLHLRSAADHVARYGGEEFVVLLSFITRAEAQAVAERIRHAIAQPIHLPTGEKIVVTASIGLAQATAKEEADHLLARADEAAYAAKDDGRDRLRIAA